MCRRHPLRLRGQMTRLLYLVLTLALLLVFVQCCTPIDLPRVWQIVEGRG